MTLQEIYNAQGNQQKELVVSVPELTHLVKHLDLLYSQLMKGNKQESEQGESLVNILGKPYVQTKAWYNPGVVKQSTSIA